jgi:hypothetical protein
MVTAAAPEAMATPAQQESNGNSGGSNPAGADDAASDSASTAGSANTGAAADFRSGFGARLDSSWMKHRLNWPQRSAP